MREIEFRAWDKDNLEMFTYKDIGDVIFGLENDGSVSLYICDSEESPVIDLMQYTGLKDANGVKIFEGDIVDYVITQSCYNDERRSVIKFKDGKFTKIGLCHNPVRVGNIYENPELLHTKWARNE